MLSQFVCPNKIIILKPIQLWLSQGVTGVFYQLPEHLMTVQLPVFHRNYCNQHFKQVQNGIKSQNITSQMFCAGFKKGMRDTCNVNNKIKWIFLLKTN